MSKKSKPLPPAGTIIGYIDIPPQLRSDTRPRVGPRELHWGVGRQHGSKRGAPPAARS